MFIVGNRGDQPDGVYRMLQKGKREGKGERGKAEGKEEGGIEGEGVGGWGGEREGKDKG